MTVFLDFSIHPIFDNFEVNYLSLKEGYNTNFNYPL